MRKALLAVLLIACADHHAADPAKIPALTVDQVDHELAAGNCLAVDANGDATRKRMGVVPGAILISGDDDLARLPADKHKELVFYCANPHCGASHTAAEHALTAGYVNVRVMPDGIAGWVKAGKNVQKI